ncbi:uncharacterized protein V6R79_011553 [Siganus canaliculatus]
MLGGHGRVREEQRRRQSGERDLTALRSHPRLPDTRTRPKGLVNLKAWMEDGGLAGVCQEETAGTSQSGPLRDGERAKNEADKSSKNSKTPAVSCSSSSCLSLV